MTKNTTKTSHATITTNQEKIMKKTTATPTSTSTPTPTATSTSTGGIAPLPATGAPSIATSLVPKPGTLAKRPRAPKLFTSLAAGLVKDIRESTTYAADFGKNAPSQDDLATRIELAAGWANEDVHAKAWSLYAHAQATGAWQATQPRLYELAPVFKYAMQRDPTIAERYASVVSFFGLAEAAAQRGLATKRDKKKGEPTEAQKVTAAKATVKAQVIAEEAAKDATAAPPPTQNGAAASSAANAH